MAARMLYFTLLVAVFTIFTSAQFIPPASLVPQSCTCKNVELICFYNKACNPTCSGQPDPASCTQSIDYACKKLAAPPPTEQRLHRNQLLRLPQSSLRQRDRPMRSPDTLQRYPDDHNLRSMRAELSRRSKGAARPRMWDLRLGVWGVTINFAFCDENLYSIVDLTKPVHALGNANQLQIVPSEVLALKAPP